MVCRIAGFYTNGRVIVNIFRNQIRQSRACCLSFHGREVPFILIADGHKEILCSCTVSQCEAPACCCRGNVCSTIVCHVINDFLCKGSTAVIYCSPESGLLIFCPQGEICVILACCCDQRRQGCHTFPVFFQAKDRLAVQSSRAVIGRIAIYIHAENYIINCDRCSVREGQIIPNGNVIINGTVVVLGHLQIRSGIVGVVCSVVRTGLTFDTFLHDSALSVSAYQTDLGHINDMLIFYAGCKERREFSLKMCAGCYQSIRAACRCTSICCLCCAFRSRCSLCLAGAIAASAASQRTGHHGKRKQSCKSLVRLFHVNPPFFEKNTVCILFISCRYTGVFFLKIVHLLQNIPVLTAFPPL